MEDAKEVSKSALKKAEKAAKMAADKAARAAKKVDMPVVGGKKADDIIGITASKNDNFPLWYQEVVIKAQLIEYYEEISGFYIMRPAACYVWSVIRNWFQERIETLGVEECSFPMFMSATALEKEKDHIAGFAPELAWVTKAGDKDLEVPVAVRATSETIMYPSYAKWIRSHRDLPLRLNQWNSVVRWEVKQCTPFLRSREFAWQEGHTAHLTEELAGKEVLEILELYAGIYEQLLAVPVVRGRKTEAEKFAGGYYTTTTEAYIPSNGRGIQGATSHCLGQNFSKMFDIKVEDPSNRGQHINVWQNSWGLSTRVIGVMVMIHGDDKGLVLPPRIAKVQAVLVPVGLTAKMSAEDKDKHIASLDALLEALRAAGVRAHADLRDGYTPAWKFNDWELKGVPLRLEYGPKDAAKQVVSFARRDTGEKGELPLAQLGVEAHRLLARVQQDMYDRADAAFRAHRLRITDWAEVVPALDAKNVVLIPSCLTEPCEARIKELTKGQEATEVGVDGQKAPSMGMKSLCVPFEQPPEGSGLVQGVTKCLNPECGKLAEKWCMFGRSY